jgi:hypothetical protein
MKMESKNPILKIMERNESKSKRRRYERSMNTRFRNEEFKEDLASSNEFLDLPIESEAFLDRVELECDQLWEILEASHLLS